MDSIPDGSLVELPVFRWRRRREPAEETGVRGRRFRVRAVPIEYGNPARMDVR